MTAQTIDQANAERLAKHAEAKAQVLAEMRSEKQEEQGSSLSEIEQAMLAQINKRLEQVPEVIGAEYASRMLTTIEAGRVLAPIIRQHVRWMDGYQTEDYAYGYLTYRDGLWCRSNGLSIVQITATEDMVDALHRLGAVANPQQRAYLARLRRSVLALEKGPRSWSNFVGSIKTLLLVDETWALSQIAAWLLTLHSDREIVALRTSDIGERWNAAKKPGSLDWRTRVYPWLDGQGLIKTIHGYDTLALDKDNVREALQAHTQASGETGE